MRREMWHRFHQVSLYFCSIQLAFAGMFSWEKSRMRSLMSQLYLIDVNEMEWTLLRLVCDVSLEKTSFRKDLNTAQVCIIEDLKRWCLFGHAEKLTFRVVKTPQEFRQSEDAEVICDVISSPVPAVSWFYKNREISSDPNSKKSTCFLQ